jgi:hypothetical protein
VSRYLLHVISCLTEPWWVFAHHRRFRSEKTSFVVGSFEITSNYRMVFLEPWYASLVETPLKLSICNILISTQNVTPSDRKKSVGNLV